jgi:hypothetical protein
MDEEEIKWHIDGRCLVATLPKTRPNQSVRIQTSYAKHFLVDRVLNNKYVECKNSPYSENPEKHPILELMPDEKTKMLAEEMLRTNNPLWEKLK